MGIYENFINKFNFFLISFSTFSKEVVVEMLNKRDDGQMVFSEDVVKVDVGDTVNGLLQQKGTMLNSLLVLMVLLFLQIRP